ncbi:unnamed protein product [Didymodactylos carnosus]|uniref:DNA repair protein REV1 n=1 Tax=Didymodactylos carnosus TaxID=1234261 RepID=A0A8S2DL31_9BILA|nr:unnamed protein product [Didymodactylos carnosus]CAF3727204.1 unnamed protein product [Didymodactylos carnosus]
MANGRGRERTGNGWEEWGGYMECKKRKLEEQFENDCTEAAKKAEIKSNIFHGISIFVDGYTEPPAEQLKQLMMEHGGTYHAYYSKEKVTYMISANLPYCKLRRLKANDKIIKPEWIVDCVKEGKLLPITDYELYAHLTRSHGQKKLNFRQISKDMVENDVDEDENNDFAQDDEFFNNETDEITHVSKTISNNNYVDDVSGDNDDRLAMNAKNPKFLSTFFKRSRLHYLSATATEMKSYVQELQQTKNLQELDQSRQTLMKRINLLKTDIDQEFKFNGQIIMHIDMDCFFVSVATRDKPELRDQPIAITHSKGVGPTNTTTTMSDQFYSRAEIASCNYPARQFGVKNGMYLGQAQELCGTTKLLCLNYDFQSYHKISHLFYDIILKYTLDVEAISCDEMYVDLTELLNFYQPIHPLTIVTCLRNEIQMKTNCPCSAGLGSNMLLARLATKKAKPNGQYYVSKNDEKEFMLKQRIIDLPRIGHAILDKLQQRSIDIETCEQLQIQFTLDQLKQIFGQKNGQTLYDSCRGIDHRQLAKEHVQKSISVDVNYGIRLEKYQELEQFVKQLADELSQRLRKSNKKGKLLTLKIRLRLPGEPIETSKFMGCGKTTDTNKSVQLLFSTDDPVVIETETLNLIKKLNIVISDLRGIGIQMTKFDVQKSKESASHLFPVGNKTLFDCKMFNLPKKAKSATETDGFGVDNDQQTNECMINEKRNERSTIDKHLEGQATTSADNVIQRAETTTASNIFSPGQIDPDVLDQLPNSIREEVEQHLKARVQYQRTKNSTPITTRRLSEPNKSVAETSFTQVIDHLDENVLNELPEEMRREIMGAKKTRKISIKYDVVKKKPPVPLPVVSNQNNAFAVIMQSPQKQSVVEKAKGSTKSNPIKKLTSNIHEEEEGRNTTSVTSKTRQQQQQPLSTYVPPQLMGRQTLNEVKLLLTNWIKTSDSPSCEDINHFQSYLEVLLEEYNTEMIYTLLRFTMSQIKSKKNNDSWTHCFACILDNIQILFEEILDIISSEGFMYDTSESGDLLDNRRSSYSKMRVITTDDLGADEISMNPPEWERNKLFMSKTKEARRLQWRADVVTRCGNCHTKKLVRPHGCALSFKNGFFLFTTDTFRNLLPHQKHRLWPATGRLKLEAEMRRLELQAEVRQNISNAQKENNEKNWLRIMRTIAGKSVLKKS